MSLREPVWVVKVDIKVYDERIVRNYQRFDKYVVKSTLFYQNKNQDAALVA